MSEQEKRLMEQRKQLRWPHIQQMVCLDNTGNACYANASMNFLLASPFLTKLFTNIQPVNELLDEVGKVCRKEPGNSTNLLALRNAIASMMPQVAFFNGNTQEDASEFIITLFEALHRNLPETEKTRFQDYFSTGIKVSFTCSGRLSHNTTGPIEQQLFLHLPVVQGEKTLKNLIDIVNKYFREESLVRNCPSCPSHLCVKKQHLQVLPKALIIHYMRFQNANGNKLNHKIAASTMLSLNDIEYRLAGILIHSGNSAHSGHYRSVTICWRTGNVFLMDDNRMYRREYIDLRPYIQDAYMLMYVRVSPEDQPQRPRLTDVVAEIEPLASMAPTNQTSQQKKRLNKLKKYLNKIKTLGPATKEPEELTAKWQTWAETRERDRTERENETWENDRADEQRKTAAAQAEQQREDMNKKQAETNVDEQMDLSGIDDLPSPQRAGAGERPAPATDQMPANDCTMSGDDELPTPDYVPMGAKHRDQSARATVIELTSEESDFIDLVKEIDRLSVIPAKVRTDDEKKKLRNMKNKHKKNEKLFKHLEALFKQKAKTAAERKAAQRAKQNDEAREAERAADRARKANEEARAANRHRMASQQARAADLARKTNKRNKRSVQPRDGLRAKEVLAGTLIVPFIDDTEDSIGNMDVECPYCSTLKFKNEPPSLCCNNGKIVSQPFPKPPPPFMKLL